MGERVHNLAIYGMTCGCCTGRVMRVLRSNPEVLDAKLSFENENTDEIKQKLFDAFNNQNK